MDALYTVKNEYTYEEYRKLSYYCMFASWVSMAIICALLAVVLVYSIISGFVILTCYAIGIFVLIPILLEYRFKKAYKSGKYKDDEVTMRFYAEYMEGEASSGTTKALYKNLHEVWETKTSFYIMMGNNMGFIVMKEKCSDELIEFIRTLKKD